MRVILARTLRLARPALQTKFPDYRFYSQAAPAMDPFQESEMKQKLVLVDENDRMIGWNTKEVCHRVKNGKIPLHRAFSVFVFNSKKEMLLQQRAPCKVTYPSHITNACCSHPLYNITNVALDEMNNMKLAVQRRLGFELGINRTDASPQAMKFITKIHYFSAGDGQWGEHEIDYIFVMFQDMTIVPNPMEVKRVWSIPRDEFNDFIEQQDYPLTPWFKLIQKNWLAKIWDNLDDLKAIRDDKIHRCV